MSVDNFSFSVGSGLNTFSKTVGSGKDSLEGVRGSLTSSGGTLSTSAIVVNLGNTTFFPASGQAKVIKKSDGTTQLFSFTGKTLTTLTGCTIASGTFAFSAGDKIEIT